MALDGNRSFPFGFRDWKRFRLSHAIKSRLLPDEFDFLWSWVASTVCGSGNYDSNKTLFMQIAHKIRGFRQSHRQLRHTTLNEWETPPSHYRRNSLSAKPERKLLLLCYSLFFVCYCSQTTSNWHSLSKIILNFVEIGFFEWISVRVQTSAINQPMPIAFPMNHGKVERRLNGMTCCESLNAKLKKSMPQLVQSILFIKGPTRLPPTQF